MMVRNNPSAVHWNAEDGYQPNIDEKDLFRFRVFASGLFNTHFVDTEFLLDNSFKFCGYFAPGFSISVNPPDEIPQLSSD